MHIAQLMSLPLTVSCFSKIQIGFTFLVPAHPVVPEKGPLNVCVCDYGIKETIFVWRAGVIDCHCVQWGGYILGAPTLFSEQGPGLG